MPYTTIVGFYEKGYDNIKLRTLKILAAYFDCSFDYLVDDTVTEKDHRYATPMELREIGIEWMRVSKKAKESGLTPEQVQSITDVIKNGRVGI